MSPHMRLSLKYIVPCQMNTNDKETGAARQCVSLIQGGAKRSRDDFERKTQSTSESAEPAAPLPGRLLMSTPPP